ncbi:probable basic-leucine zipper transcription factor N [Haliotis asinina]|uniref:probable basic-leucine zipper transcription factor N n=1 Tax=Haliotis asinina TaxID=109174 RepID=UPI00353214D5
METAECMWRILILASVGSLTSGQYMTYDSDTMDTMQDMAEDRHTYMMYQRLYGGSGTQYNTQASYAKQQRPAYQYNYQSSSQNTYGRNTNGYGANNYGRNTNAYNNNANGGNMYQHNTQQQSRNYQQNGGYNNMNAWSQNRGSNQRSQSWNSNNGVNSQLSNSPVSAQNYLQRNQGGSFQQGSVNTQAYQQQVYNSGTNGQVSQSFNNQQSQQSQAKCSQVTLDIASGRSAVNVPGAVISISLIQQTQWSRCTSASFGFIGRYAYVGNDCSGNFKVCYQ